MKIGGGKYDVHDISRRTKRISFKRPGGTINSMNEVDNTGPVTVASRWAAVRTLKGTQEGVSGVVFYDKKMMQFITNYSSTLLDKNLYITYKDQDYDIQDIDNVNEQDETIIYTAQIRSGGGIE